MTVVRFPAPYDFRLSTSRFRAYGRDLANLWSEDGGAGGADGGDAVAGALWRVVDGSAVRIAAGAAAGEVEVEVAGGAGGEEVAAQVHALLGGAHDTASFAAFVAAAGDPVLAALHARHAGFRPPLAPDPFEALVTAITAQQVSLHSAFAVRNRLIAAYGAPAREAAAAPPGSPEATVRAFPRAATLAAVDPGDLVPLGFSRRKAEYVVGVAQALPGLGGLGALPDAEVKARLVAIRGLGEWTADWFLARHLARPEAWPAGDLVLRKACSRHYADGRELATPEVRALGDRFAPFQNLTAQLLLIATTQP